MIEGPPRGGSRGHSLILPPASSSATPPACHSPSACEGPASVAVRAGDGDVGAGQPAILSRHVPATAGYSSPIVRKPIEAAAS